MKKITSIILALVVIISSPLVVSAHSDEANEYIGEIVVEVESEEEFLNYPCISGYRYTFIIPNQRNPRTICYNCGKPYLGLATLREQSTSFTVRCPYNGLSPDIFMTWNNYSVERCTYCHMQNIVGTLPDTYTSWCHDYDEDYEVRKEWTQEAGYDLHKCYDYWMNPGKYNP